MDALSNLTGEVSLREVTATFVRDDHVNSLTIEDENGNMQVLEVTDAHPFWVVTDEPDLQRAAREVVTENGVVLRHDNIAVTEHGYYVEAKDLRDGDVFVGLDGRISKFIAGERVLYPDGIKVYNFTVDGNHNYFVVAPNAPDGQASVLVHNAEYGARTEFTPSQFRNKYLGSLNRNEIMIYARGCVGISMVALRDLQERDGKMTDAEKYPHQQSGAKWFQSYDDAKKFYDDCRLKDKKPALMMVAVVGGYSPYYGKKFDFTDPDWFGNGKGILTLGGFDYCLLANIDIGGGKQPCWIHASGAWHDNPSGGSVIATPVAVYKDPRDAFFVVIEDVPGRKGLKFDINFEIPKITSSALPSAIKINP